MNSRRTQHRCQDLKRLAKDLFSAYNIREWNFTFDRAKARAGACDYGTKTISLSIHFVSNPKTTRYHLHDVLLHEIAHALTPDHDHDNVWKETAKSIGCSGRMYAPHFASEPRFRIRCPCKSVDFRRHIVKEAHMDTVCMDCDGDVLILGS
jgi:hypothetical protein